MFGGQGPGVDDDRPPEGGGKTAHDLIQGSEAVEESLLNPGKVQARKGGLDPLDRPGQGPGRPERGLQVVPEPPPVAEGFLGAAFGEKAHSPGFDLEEEPPGGALPELRDELPDEKVERPGRVRGLDRLRELEGTPHPGAGSKTATRSVFGPLR